MKKLYYKIYSFVLFQLQIYSYNKSLVKALHLFEKYERLNKKNNGNNKAVVKNLSETAAFITYLRRQKNELISDYNYIKQNYL